MILGIGMSAVAVIVLGMVGTYGLNGKEAMKSQMKFRIKRSI